MQSAETVQSKSCLFFYVFLLLEHYMVGVGTSPLTDDIGEFVDVNNMRFSHCFYGLSLTHKARYYGTLIAFNGGHKELNTTGYSDGGRNAQLYVYSALIYPVMQCQLIGL